LDEFWRRAGRSPLILVKGGCYNSLLFQAFSGACVLIPSAFAQQAPAGAPGGDMSFLIMMILMFVVLYFFMIRPQMKRQKEQKKMIDELQKGDEVITAGGVVGRISKISESYLTLEIAPNTEIVVQRMAVSLLLPKGTLKSLQ
jgi:preprotein translocase subunit YajC